MAQQYGVGKSLFDSVECDNYVSATCPENREKVELQITEDLKMGNYIITYHKPNMISAIEAIPKRIVMK